MSRRMITVLVVFVLAPLVLATLAAVGLFAYAVDDLLFACDRLRPQVEHRVDRLVEDVPELRLTHVEPSGCDSGDDPAIAGRPRASLDDLDRALVDHGCRPGPADFTDIAWECPGEGITISYFGPDQTGGAAEVDVRRSLGRDQRAVARSTMVAKKSGSSIPAARAMTATTLVRANEQ